MKIYFEDGQLAVTNFSNAICSTQFYAIDASHGVSACMNAARYLQAQGNPNTVIYTNCLELFRNEYAWNDELKVPEIYIRHKDADVFIRIDKATPKALREAHNLRRMYVAGTFDSVTNALDSRPVLITMNEFPILRELDKSKDKSSVGDSSMLGELDALKEKS